MMPVRPPFRPPRPKPLRITAVALLALPVLTGCAGWPERPPASASVPAAWAAPLPQEAAWPHEGRLSTLVDWWRQQSDPVIVTFIEAAQQVSPSISSAQSRLAQARAERIAAGAGLLPSLDLTGSALKRSATPPLPAGQVYQGGLQVSWEIDLFGGQQAAREAAQWRLRSADAAWHEARVSVAADVALQTYAWRHCQVTLQLMQDDARAAERSAAHVTRLAEVGLQPATQAAQAQADAAESRNRARQQAVRCEIDTKSLVMLTGLPEAEVRRVLTAQPIRADGGLSAPRLVQALPAQTLAQRPDVFMAAAAVAAAAAEVGQQDAQRYPRLGLTGSVGRLRSVSNAGTLGLETWSIGPLSLSLPVFDAGRRSALSEAARARHVDARKQHEAVVRRAVREVEEALLQLAGTADQAADAQRVVDAARATTQATQRRAQQGLASALELEEARRRQIAAEMGWLQLQRDRIAAWIGLYRAAGGGWQPSDPVSTERAPASPAAE